MKYPIRILHVLGGLNRGGAETMVMNLYRNIDRNKVQFDFIVHTKEKCDYDEEIKSLGGRIYNIPQYKGKNHLQYKNDWRRFFEQHKEYKIIHGHVRSTAAVYLKIAKKFGLTTISHSHSTSSGRGVSAIVKTVFQYPIRYIADYLFACSDSAGKWLFGKKVCEKHNFFVLNNAIDSSKYIYNEGIRVEIRNEFQLDDKLVIGHVGRFDRSKNHKFLIDIFKVIHNINDNAVLILIGDGELRYSIEKKVNDLGLTCNVIFTGVRSDVADLLQAMDIFVFPSLFEGLPVTVIEAQASGLQCILSDTITKEVTITDMIESVSLMESPEEWAKIILDKSVYCNRQNTYKEVVKYGYDIKETSDWLQKFYLGIITKHHD